MIEITPLASSSSGNAYLVTDGRSPLLIDCGMRFKELRQALDFSISTLAGCLLSHEHKDHSRAVADLMKAGIDVYASPGTIKALGLAGHRVHTVWARQQFNLASWTILPYETQHDAAEPVGFLMASLDKVKLLYATDTYYIRYRFRGLNYLMLECNYSGEILRSNVEIGVVSKSLKSRIIRSHFSLENVKKFLMANDLSQVKEIHLMHLSDDNADVDRFKREIQELTGKPVMVANRRADMIKRVCGSCGEEHYSADTTDRPWTCRRCGRAIPKDREEVAR